MMFKYWLLLAAVALSACSPTLNWRTVHLQQMTALLPCKPDQAQRMVRLGPMEVQMRMAGCEADGAMFALSQVDVGARNNIPAALDAWRAVTLANLGSANPTALPFNVTLPLHTSSDQNAAVGVGQTAIPPERVAVTGKRADGSRIQAQLAWMVDGTSLYQIAVYGAQLTPDMTDTLFSEIKIQ